MKTYELFRGEELNIAEKIQQRRLQILIHSCIYYEYNKNIISDRQFDIWAKELVQLQKDYPDIASQIIYADAFKGFDASTGFDLPIYDENIQRIATRLCGTQIKQNKAIKTDKPVTKLKKHSLF